MQTAYSQNPETGYIGQVTECESPHIETFPAAEDVYPGRLVEIVNGKIRHPQATTLGKIAGIVLRDPTRENTTAGALKPYALGEPVPVLRQGTCWAEFNGGTPVQETLANVKHASSDVSSNAQHRGKFTQSATSVTVGSEASATVIMFRDAQASTSRVKVEINIP